MNTDEQNKYLNASEIKLVIPNPNFYKFYNDSQRLDIIENLEVNHEVPRQYNYFGKGAEHWDNYVQRLSNEDMGNTLTSTINLLRNNRNYINRLIQSHSFVNVVDIGVGNAYPTKELLQYLIKQGKLGRYIALDISKSMLRLAKKNITKWFNDDVIFEGHVYDINRHHFLDLISRNTEKYKSDKNFNLMLLLGGTLSNMRNPDNAYKMIHDSMTNSDVLVHVTKLDTDTSRKYFDFNASSNTVLSPSHKIIFDLLNIDESTYDVEMGYNPSIKERYIRVRLRVAISIGFKLENRMREVLLRKNDTILIWRGIQHTRDSLVSRFNKNSFNVMHINETDDKSYILTVSCIK